MSLLEVEDLRTGYGALPVLHGVSFAIEEGTTTVLLGLNGAGKSTTVNAIAGLVKPWSGAIRFDGQSIGGRPANEIVSLGISLSLEGRHVFPALSVRDNLELGAWTKRDGMKAMMDTVFEYFPRVQERADQLAGTLSGGEQQMVAIARAMMAHPRLLLIDEASLGLSPLMAETVFHIVDRIKASGTTVILVEQNIGALDHADRALVMEKGTITFDGPPSRLAEESDLERVYLGEVS
jgi:branched-chain amino acid transport system ATP-binding protein